MAHTKTKNASKTSSTPRSSDNASPFFPYARYISIVGVHTSLLAFAALFLPRSAFADFSSPSAARERGKRDGMDMLTENPLRTIGWMCFGALILQVWWASWVRYWALDAIQSTETKEKDNKDLTTKDTNHAEKTERRVKYHERESANMQVGLDSDSSRDAR